MKKYIGLALLALVSLSCSKKGSDNVAPANNSNSNSNNNNSTCTLPLPPSRLNSVQLFPAAYAINQDISSEPVDMASSGIINAIGPVGLHPDFGTFFGIPFTLVCGNQPKVTITYRANSYDNNYGSESSAGPFPIPAEAPVEGNGSGDSHVLVCDVENNMLYELYNASKDASGSGWSASCGVTYNLKSIPARPSGYTSADAAGLPVLPCLVRYDEVASGKINHALRFTISKKLNYNGYLSPANHKVNGTGALGSSLPMGARLRLKASVDISSYSAANQVILTAMKKYGIILADIGSDMFFTGAPDSRWDDSDLHNLTNIKATDFELVKMGTIH